MSSTKTKNAKKNARDIALANSLVPAAHEVMQAEYHKKTGRVKLTHFWLAEQLNIKNHIAFRLLVILAYHRRHYCVKLPLGPIFWDNDLIPVGVVMDAVKNARTEARRLEQKLMMEMP